MGSAPHTSSVPTPAVSGLVVPLALGVLLGVVLPLSWGLAAPLAVTGLLWVAVVIRDGAVRAAASEAGGWQALVRAQSRPIRVLLGIMVGLSCVVFVAVGARAVGGTLMAYPAAVWSVGAMILLGATGLVLRGRLRGPWAVGAAVLVLALSLAGDRFEAAAPDARGWAHSGPLLGIHPFQTTAVMVDGYGPYDLPINDYVEPDGARGYGAAELAEAVELALHVIAEQQFAHGPARARKAFGEARGMPSITDGVEESLGRAPEFSRQPRFRIESGTHGPRSRVEFLCPGTRNDPRPREPDPVMNKMCPDKYAAEASAGLGLTGRWAGYTEGRGNERFGLARLVGATRSDDEAGQRVVRWELRVWGFLVLALGLAVTLARRGAAGRSTAELGGAVGVLAILVAVLAVPWMGSPAVGFTNPGAPWAEPLRAGAWIAALVPAVGLLHLLEGNGARSPRWLGVAFAPVVVGTAWVASHLRALAWTSPDPWGHGGALPLEQWIGGVGGALASFLNLDVQQGEALVAGAVACLCLALVVVVLPLGARGLQVAVASDREDPSAASVVIMVILAACLVVSRKTGGGTPLLYCAVATCLVLGSSLGVLSGRQRLAPLRHLFWVVVAAGVVVEPLLAGGDPAAILLLGTVGGLVLVFGSLLVLFRGAPGPQKGPDGANSGG